jgi:GTP-binding protein
MDLLGDEPAPPIDAEDAYGVFAISAAGRTGLEPMIAAWWSRLLEFKKVTVKRDDSVPLP